ncbi:MAG: SpoIIE family protein phosphatase [Ruminococcus sp.]|nr:SpoIIE family protein phosphatase [Ruminococcus sp.]
MKRTGRKNYAQRRIALISAALILFTSLILTLFSALYYNSFTTSSTLRDAQRFKDSFYKTMEGLDAKELESWYNDDKTVYDSFRTYLRTMCGSAGFDYLYIFKASRDSEKMTYLMSVAADDEKDETMKRERGFGAQTDLGDRSFVDAALDGELSGPERLSNEFGSEFTYYFPVYDEDGKITYIVGMDFDVTEVKHEAISYVVRTVLIVTSVLIAVLVVLLLVLRKKVFIPIKRIAEQMNSFDPETEHQKQKIDSYYEIEEINNSFAKLSEDISGYISNLRAMSDERARNAAELNIARRIQTGMVPSVSALSGSGFELYATACPAKEVGGDLYDCFESDGRVCTVIADVSGKGIAAALFMAMAKTIIKGRLRSELDPAAALNSANDELCAENPEGMFVTVFASVLDPRTGELIYANAGHTRPLIVDGSGKRYIVPEAGIALGLFEDAGIVNEVIVLENGTCITVYTDGMTEAVSGSRELFGEKRLIEAASGGTAEQTALSLTEAVRSFSEGCEQSDDMTLVSLRFATEDRIIREELPSEMSSLDRMRSLLLELASGCKSKRHIALACEEIFVNIVEYSKTERICVLMSRSANSLTVRFEDTGEPFDPLSEMPSEKDFDDYDQGGMGIRLVTKIADGVRYSRIGGKNIITMVFSV